MRAGEFQDPVLRDYLDALLHADSEPAPAEPQAETRVAAAWLLCNLGRLQLLLPADKLGPPVDRTSLVETPAHWHLAEVHVGADHRRVMELTQCIAPGMAAAPVESLLPITNTDWLLAVPGQLQPLALPEDAIQWRPRRNSRPWLTGMSCDARYMALDVHELVAQAAGEPGAALEEPSS